MSLSFPTPVTGSVSLPPDERRSTLPVGEPGLTLGWEAIAWAETFLVQPNGPRSGQPFHFTIDQMRFMLWWYALEPDGEWVYTHGVRRLAKGSGKSPFAAVLSLIEFCAPIRLDRKDSASPGGVRGRPVPMPWVQIAATAESQTKNTMRMVRAFAPKGSKVVTDFRLDPGKTMYYKVPEGQLEIITSSATAAEGAESTFLVADETEHWLPSNGGVELHAVVSDNLAKSGSRMLETCNAWVPGRSSVAEGSWEAWLAQEEGRTKGDGRMLYDARIAPANTDMSDEDSLREALEFVYADCDWKKPHDADNEPIVGAPPDVRPIMRKIWSPTTDPNDSRRKYLNRPSVASDAWIDPTCWQQMHDPERVVGRREEVALFFDGSRSRDATALVGCTISDGHVFTLGVWEPDQYDTESTVDFSDVDRVLQKAMDEHNVVAFFADVREWESYVLTEWPQRYADGMSVWAAPSSRPPQPIAWDMRGHSYEFAKATEATHAEIVTGSFTHDGHPAVARHVGNCRRRPYRDAIAVGKASPASPAKIDAAVCVIGARMVRRLVLGSASKKRQRTGRVV